MENPAGVDPPEDNAARCPQYTSSEEEQNRSAPTTEDRVAGKRPLVADPSPAETLPAESSLAPKRRCTASDVDPDHMAGQRTAEPAAVVGDAAPQTTEEQPAATTAAESTEEHPAPVRDGEAARTPVMEEEGRAPTPPPAEEGRVPTPSRAEALSPGGSPGLDQGPVMPATTAGGSAEGAETRTTSDDEVEEIQGRPQDGLEEEVARLRQENERLDQE
ncbi:skin secretory protein xP2-like [Sorghum bicolor]|uniref:skin secretory protein xP2-like n=1 Tax=Sorghum bicolor TaxID=4558 RepID=UPI000B425E27|nr:skin secretory protein xP2-like [Sorghum bicolor]|eukprot:XP_021317639.1 skin secretory protein xP2-like [Sorghum bicolor]